MVSLTTPTSETDQLGGVGAVMQKAVDAEWIATGLRVIADGNEAPCDFDRRILRRAADIIAPTQPASNARQVEGTVV